MRWLRGVLVLSLAGLLNLAWQPDAVPPARVTARAWQAVGTTPRDVLVTLQGYPDLSAARAMPTKEQRTQFVAQALMAHAAQSQSALIAALRARGKPFMPLWISNQVWVRSANRADLRWLAAQPGVAQVDLDVQFRGVQAHVAPRSAAAPSTVEWGVQRVRAPEVWAMGYTGQGIVIANLDTGVRWQHDALKPSYRGWDGTTADHNYHWFDAAPGNAPPATEPQDLNGHGTHTVGTSNGDDGAGNQIGVAPGARWIACRNMEGSSGIGSVARYTACFQFALAPTDVNGSNPNPSLAADITSNSWACDPNYGEQGCEVPTALVTVTQALRDAGIMVIAAAGNSGPACGSVSLAPATLSQAFSIGATNSSDLIASFSSRGPSALTGNLKPDVVAPGVSVRSAYNLPNGYAYLSGTSMATPHVAGVAALVWSAAPWLRGDVDATEALLRRTARPLTTTTQTCGGVPGTQLPNNTYGYGLVDALEAVNHATSILTTSAPALHFYAQPLTYTVTFTNLNSFTRTNVLITTTLPTGSSLVSSDPPATQQGSALVWTVAQVPPGATLVFTYALQLAQPGLVSNAPVQVWFDGLGVPVSGAPAETFAYAHRYWLTLVRNQGE